MKKSATTLRLEAEVHSLKAYQEAFFCLRKGEVPVRFASGEWAVEVLGLGRTSGGVVLVGSMVTWADEWIATVSTSGNPHLAGIARAVAAQRAK